MGLRFKHIKKAYEDIPDHYHRVAFWGAVFIGVPTTMMWLASQLSWFWHWFGWFGLAFVALVTITVLMVLMAAYRHWKSSDPKAELKCDARAKPVRERQINWGIWKKRSRYTLSEFADILAKCNPDENTLSYEAKSFRNLIFEQIRDKKLSYIPRRRANYRGDPEEIPVDLATEISREKALKWAHENDFPVAHIE